MSGIFLGNYDDFFIKGVLMMKEICTQLFLHDDMSGINTIVFTHTLPARQRKTPSMKMRTICKN